MPVDFQLVLKLVDLDDKVYLFSLAGKRQVLDGPSGIQSRELLMEGSSVSLAMPKVDDLPGFWASDTSEGHALKALAKSRGVQKMKRSWNQGADYVRSGMLNFASILTKPWSAENAKELDNRAELYYRIASGTASQKMRLRCQEADSATTKNSIRNGAPYR